ncbi:MAG: response regulator transcription factor [Eubacteriales bacterium]
MSAKILIADDDPMLRRLLGDILRKQSYETVLTADGQEAMDQFFDQGDIDLCILDVMMPYYTGYEVLEVIREHSDVPVIMLTALGTETNELDGLQQGANDYIAKPCSYPILLARVENLLQMNLKKKEQVWIGGALSVDCKGHLVWVAGQEVLLNNKEFTLLSMLITNEDQVLSREQLLDHIWGYDYEGDIRTVDTHVKMLRKKLEQCGDYIVTVRGAGYKLQVNL